MTYLRLFFDRLKRAFFRFQAHDAAALGAELSYFTLMSLVPALVVVIAILGFLLAQGLPSALSAKEFVLLWVEGTLPGFYVTVAEILDTVEKERGQITLLGLIPLVFSASGVFATLQRTLNIIFECPSRADTIVAFILGRAIATAMVFGSVLLFLVAIIADTVIKSLARQTATLPGSVIAWQFLNPLISLLTTVLIFVLIYRVIPNRKLGWRQVLPGAVLAAIVWEIARQVFTWFLASQSFSSLYGPLAGVIGVMLWIYFAGQILFFGAEFAAAKREETRD